MPAALRHFDVPDARRRELLAYLSEREVCPSWREIKKALRMGADLLSFLLADMEAKGQIRRLRNRDRAIEVLHPLPSKYPEIVGVIEGESVRFKFIGLKDLGG
jgi:SOS-response transcriptional repressor LexA